MFLAAILLPPAKPHTIPDDKARELGADHVINHYQQKISEEVRKITNKEGVDIVVEHVGAATWDESVRSLKTGGKLVTCAATTAPKGAPLGTSSLVISQPEAPSSAIVAQTSPTTHHPPYAPFTTGTGSVNPKAVSMLWKLGPGTT